MMIFAMCMCGRTERTFAKPEQFTKNRSRRWKEAGILFRSGLSVLNGGFGLRTKKLPRDVAAPGELNIQDKICPVTLERDLEAALEHELVPVRPELREAETGGSASDA